MEEDKTDSFYKRQIRNISLSEKNLLYQDNFDNTHYTIFKKTERLTTAVYLITDFFNDKEALRWELRAAAASFLSFIVRIYGSSDCIQKDFILKYSRGSILHIISLLELALRIHLVSPMNFNILQEEFMSLYTIIKEITSEEIDNAHSFSFPQNFFAPSFKQGKYDELWKLDNKRTEPNFGSAPYKGQYQDKRHAFSDNKKVEKDKNNNDNVIKSHKKEQKINRKKDIISFLKTKGEASIKDISATISGCSEKTIQRDLLSLMSSGIVERRGKRRWSTYTMKQNALGITSA